MSIDVNAIEQTVVVTAVGDEVNVNIIDQPVLVSVTDQIIEVEASGGTGPQGPAGAGVAAGGTTGQVLSKASNTNYDTVWVDAGAGTVYSVDASGSTGISVTGGPITGAGTLTITNTAPDQVVALTGAGTAVITGTYPNFTITTNDEFDGTVTSVNLTAGTGISVSGGPITGSGSISVTNTAPDQVVSLTGSGTTTISGTYPNFTISSTDSKVGTVTSVDMTVPTGLTISGNPITSAGTLALALASGYSIPTTASQANWNTAYNDSITSASVSGTSTKTLTLNQQDGGTVTASWSDIDTGLTSVGLSMPSAFAVANSPLTSNGTIAVTGAGTSAQYVRGDGQLANFPSTSGGGSSVNYYLNGSVSQGTFGGDTYYEMSKSPIAGAGTNFTRTSAQGNGYIASFITDANDPSLLVIPGGNWNLEFYFNASSGGGTPSFYAELYKVSSSNVFTLVASGSTNPEGITQGTVVDQYFTSIPVAQTALLATDRIAVRIYVLPDGRNITLHTENSNLCEVLTTFSTGLNALNGLTAQVQYFATSTIGTDFNIQSLTDTHTFNLPVASGSNTGKLSNVDWLTFDGKENVLTFSAPLSRSVNTVSIPVATTSQPGYLDSTDWTTFNAKVTSVSATSPLFSTGGKTPTLTIQQASGSQNGYLSSTDWTTFNGKQNAITLTTTGSSGASTFISNTLNVPTYTLSGLGGVPTTRTLTINGTSYDLSANRTWSVGTITTAAATTGGQVSFFNGATVITSVSGLYFDGVDKLGVGNSSPAYNLDVTGTFRSTGNLTAASIIKSGGTSSQYLMADGSTSTLTNPVTGTGTTNYLPKWTSGSAIGNSLVYDSGTAVGIGTTSPTANTVLDVSTTGTRGYIIAQSTSVSAGSEGGLRVKTNTKDYYIFTDNTSDALRFYDGTASAERMRLTSGGNLLVNSTTDNGNRLQVTGNGYFSGSVGIGTTSPATKLHLNDTGISFNGADKTYIRVTSGTTTEFNIIQRNISGFVGTIFASTDSLQFHTSSISRMTIDTSGNLGLGVTPSAWGSGYKAIQAGSQSAFIGYSGNFTWVSTNALFGASSNTYIESGYATTYRQTDGTHAWFTAPSGTAGNAITFTQAMTLTANGRLLLGTTTEGTYAFTINDISGGNLLKITSGSTILDYYVSGGNPSFGTASNHDLRIKTNDVTRLTLASTGAATFSSSVTAATTITARTGFTSAGTVAAPYFDEGIIIGQGNNQNKIQYGNSFTNNNGTWMKFVVNSNTAINTPVDVMTLKYDGSVGIGTTSPSAPLDVNGSIYSRSGGLYSDTLTAYSGTSISLNAGTSHFAITVNGSERARITSGGNLLVGTTTDSGEKLQVNGTGYFASTVTLGGGSRVSAVTGNGLNLNAGGADRLTIKANGSLNYVPMATPASAVAGDVYYDSTSNKLRCYNGTSWNDLF